MNALPEMGETGKMGDRDSGDTTCADMGLSVDLGSTTVVGRLQSANSGETWKEVTASTSRFSVWVDILAPGFYQKDRVPAGASGPWGNWS